MKEIGNALLRAFMWNYYSWVCLSAIAMVFVVPLCIVVTIWVEGLTAVKAIIRQIKNDLCSLHWTRSGYEAVRRAYWPKKKGTDLKVKDLR